MREFKEEDLASFDGKDGRPAYTVVDGKVYDVSSSGLWKEGVHMGRHAAGQDLSDAIAGAPHGTEVFEQLEQVGRLRPSSARASESPPGWATALLTTHPHPITVHFPQALFATAPLFLILFYIFGNAHFERTSYYLVIAAWITSVPAFKTGLLHWVYKYGKTTKRLYLFKLVMSIVLLVYGAAVIWVHTAKGVLLPDAVDLTMLVLYLLLLPIIVSIGHAGGKIVFG